MNNIFMTFSIWLEPCSTDAIYLNDIIYNLAEKYNSPIFDSHITIDSEIEELPSKENTMKVLQKILKLDVFVSKIQFSDDIWKTLFIKLKKNSELEQIFQVLRNELFINSKYEFNPHISLIYKKLDDETKKKIISNLKIKSIFTFDKISILCSANEVTNWRKVFTYKFKN